MNSPSMIILPVDSYARLSVGWDGRDLANAGQHSYNEKAIASAGRELGQRFEDGVSAWNAEVHRTDFEDVILRMERGQSGGVSVWEHARFLRQPYELEVMLRRVRGLGCIFIGSGRAYQLDDDSDQDMLRMFTMQANRSSGDTSRRVKRENQVRREAGHWTRPGRRAFGHGGVDNTAEVDPVSGRRPWVGEAQVRRERAAIVRGVADVLAGGTVAGVMRDWQGRGLVGTMGVELNEITVRQILTRPINAGLLTYKGEVVGTATNVEPVIDEDTHQRVVALFSSRRKGEALPTTLGSGLIECGRCGHTLSSQPNKGRATYFCVKARGGCNRLRVAAHGVDAGLRELAIARLSDPSVAASLNAALARHSQRAEELVAMIERDETLATQLSKALADEHEPMPWAAFQAASKPINKRLAEYRSELEELRAITPEAMQAQDAEQVATDWDNSSVDDRRALLRAAIRGVRVVIAASGRTTNGGRFDLARVQVLPHDTPLG